ncbi:MAG TPA: glycosyltransferase family 4 protein [Noviherbaspirillum sp.]|jgi:glycosyltransferase involved in cell wall biosynthesis|uniref:glycosyltransferase family 4 protein n=1 Tax=Noviherbaspirillum sp. TaxID=1926288 RepID=UPI002F954BCA
MRERGKLRVLYIHPFGVYGGATKSLSELIAALPHDRLDAVVLTPIGQASESLAAAGARPVGVSGISQWDDTRFGHYRGFRWLILLREIARLPATLRALWKMRGEGPFDLIHCNEITALPVAIIARRLLQAPLLVHVRSLQRGAEGGAITRRLMGLLRRHANGIVAIDEAVRRTLPSDLHVEVVHNSMRIPASLPEPEPTAVYTVALIGVLHRSKGAYEFVEAARLLRDRGVPVKLLIVGENARKLSGVTGWMMRKLDFARDVRKELEDYVAAHRLGAYVEFTGFVRDIRTVYSRINAVCFPSHLDAPGRPVFEAALYGLPTIVAMRNPTRDVVVHGESGLCIDTPRPEAIADAIGTLFADPASAQAMGARARQAALTRFDSGVAAAKMWELYLRTAAPGHGLRAVSKPQPLDVETE